MKAAGEQFILKLYDGSDFKSLDAYRYIVYRSTIGRGSVNSTFTIESLTPTDVEAKQNSYRFDCSKVDGNSLSPTEWGWRLCDGILEPVETNMAVAPDSLLNLVSCGCKPDGCSSMICSCKKTWDYFVICATNA